MMIIKKDGRLENYNFNKIVNAISKSAKRVNYVITNSQLEELEENVLTKISAYEKIPVETMHEVVECALDDVIPEVAKSYRNYRNYKKDFVGMMNTVLSSADELNYKIDRSNANTTAALVSTKRSLIYTALNKEIYKKQFMSDPELQAINDGYIYIHDLGARADTYNCCLFDMGSVLQGGFEWENIGYNEPKDVRTAGNLISDITLNCAAQQYGGFTIPEIDSILAPYAEKSYKKHYSKQLEMLINMNKFIGNWPMLDSHERKLEIMADEYAMAETTKEIEQVFQGFEHTFNTVASSRGDYPFVTITGGCDETKFGNLVWDTCLKVRRNGQGHEGHKRPAIFPKIVFLYTEELHGEGKKMHWLFKNAIKTSAVASYPDYLSLDMPDETLIEDSCKPHFEPGIAKVFHKYHKFGVSRWYLDDNNKVQENPEWVDSIISPMGCRAYLSPYYEKGELIEKENDKPIFHKRFNGGRLCPIA